MSLMRTSRGVALHAALAASSWLLVGAVDHLGMLQWNPHWECFAKSAACKQQAEGELTRLLTDPDVDLDFANLVELEDAAYQLPPGWAALPAVCARDATTLLFNSRKWRPVGNDTKGCMVQNDRPFVIQAFEPLDTDHGVGDRGRLVVVGAHFPHIWQYAEGIATLRAAMLGALDAANTSKVLLIADTNLNASDPNGSSPALAAMLGAPGAPAGVVGTDLVHSCCLDSNFIFTYDRVIANFGTSMATQLLHFPTPSWAIGEFHRAVLGKLSLEGAWEKRNTKGSERLTIEFV